MKQLTSSDRCPEAIMRCLNAARSVAVLTGAGVSAESGIPTFRDAQQGLWADFDPLALASPEGFDADPERVWKWYQWRRALINENHPNAGHHALAEMESRIEQMTLITQNVDGFHQQAGSKQVLELHGNIHRSICSRTGETIDDDWIARHCERQPPPSPHHPQGLARPGVVWFGEALDTQILDAAFNAASHCDLMIIAGTAGAVQPAASLPLMARDAGARLIDINPEHGEISALADWHLVGTSAHWLPELLNKLDAAG